MIVFCFGLDCAIVQSWIRSETCLSQDLYEVFYFCFLSVSEPFCDLLLPLVRYVGS